MLVGVPGEGVRTAPFSLSRPPTGLGRESPLPTCGLEDARVSLNVEAGVGALLLSEALFAGVMAVAGPERFWKKLAIFCCFGPGLDCVLCFDDGLVLANSLPSMPRAIVEEGDAFVMSKRMYEEYWKRTKQRDNLFARNATRNASAS